ncbi:hypothetical protein [Rhodococcus jostii]|uniref:Uncharacterized protein n=1 Tax=Rhodococcus jostii TaxID=132919 RepID=A0A1H5MCE6_RHOJO|nr:hypothetical protein [Rhodococcus jostii]SEE86813.1 hypothetical protein SAMN04490220_8840 [Rhodococcus jostii]
MESVLRRIATSHAGGVAGLVVAVAYAYWATGLRPFTTLAYIAVGVPVALLTCLAVISGTGDSRGSGTPRVGKISLRSVRPWLILLMIAAGLEAVGIALGGQSITVPTLSTVIDHALAWHPVRFVLFCGWLAAGAAPVVRIMHSSRSEAT